MLANLIRIHARLPFTIIKWLVLITCTQVAFANVFLIYRYITFTREQLEQSLADELNFKIL